MSIVSCGDEVKCSESSVPLFSISEGISVAYLVHAISVAAKSSVGLLFHSVMKQTSRLTDLYPQLLTRPYASSGKVM